MQEYGRTPISAEQDKSFDLGPNIDKRFFEPAHRPFSLGEPALKGISDPSWSSPSPQAWDAVPLTMLALQKLDGSWAKLSTLWMGLLPPEGRMLYKHGSGKSGLVLVASKFGVLIWPLSQHKLSTPGRLFEFSKVSSLGFERPYEFVVIDDICDSRVLKLRLVNPMQSPGAEIGCEGLALTRDGAPQPVLQAAAQLAFPTLTVPMLDRLFDKLQVEHTGKKPKAENSLLNALIRHVLPDLGLNDVRAIISRRNKKDLEACTSDLADPAVFEQIRHTAWEGDIGEMQSLVTQFVRSRRSSDAGLGGGSASSGAARVPIAGREGISGDEGMTAEWFRRFLPEVAGCNLHKETKWHLRWKVVYTNKPLPPFGTSCTWNPEVDGSCLKAVRHCIAWAWEQHVSTGGSACPWSLDQ